MNADKLRRLGERLPMRRPLSQIIVADAEYKPQPGAFPVPICFTYKELISGEMRTLWSDELLSLKEAPFSLEEQCLFLSFNLCAEYSVMQRLGWGLPALAIDQMVEFRWHTNGREYRLPNGNFLKLYSLADALKFYGIREIDAVHKEKMQRLAVETTDWTPDTRAAMIEYNRQDVLDHESLFYAMVDQLDFPRAVHRAQYCKCIAKIERRGIPVDIEAVSKFSVHKERLVQKLISSVNNDFGVFDDWRMSDRLFRAYLERHNLAWRWPTSPTGRPRTDKDTLRDFSDVHPPLKILTSLLATKRHLAHKGLPVGPDGRNRFSMRPFMTKTGRNAPRPSECISACPGWMKNFIKPAKGRAVIQCDWEQQEHAIAACLSGDPKMIEAYKTGDPYLALGKQAGAIPENGTKETHPIQRNLFKQCSLGTLFGMGAVELGRRIGDFAKAKELIAKHKSVYPVFWEWREAALDNFYTIGKLDASFGWRIHLTESIKATTIGNFPMQANGSEMMRAATILAEERGLEIIAIMHDAFLIECDESEVAAQSALLQEVMREASRIVLDGFELRSELKVVCYPDRFESKDKQAFWNLVCTLLDECATGAHSPLPPVANRSINNK